ncbi:bifunctional tetrahydrofolate synthase/dihydrofolate synthase [Thalassotalea euphylliae]|uniref:Dihydrofolate synthase/folylpolyglutamate synthase n=2 Tax=Thalassotalea euphylliae TaxID=1655234 RepID=A0A3E0TWZ7_9GAMM|nr:bifunctional tetrahydrofolate synthase/dihydrofolate synthase [Thalassotalea euphylliae]
MKSHCDNWSLSQWLCYLETIHNQEIDLGLSRISQVATKLNINLNFAKVITVAGTNGKGTTCAFIENYLLAAKQTVAVYSSPHIERFNERLRINKVDVEDQPWLSALAAVELARADISLTYYEFTTLAGLFILQQQQPDFIILEVGLGGRLDATNMVDADIAVVTSVDLDHQAFLGDTRELIGFEKAGIFRPEKPAIVGEPNMPQSVAKQAFNIGAKLLARGRAFDICQQDTSWQWQTTQRDKNASDELNFTGLKPPYIPMDNVATALMVLAELNLQLSAERINQVIEMTKVAGRTEIFQPTSHEGYQCDIMLDVAHNPHAAKHLAKTIKRLGYQKVHAVVGMLKDKDIRATLVELSDCVDSWYFASLSGARAASAQEINSLADKLALDGNCFDNVEHAFTMAKNSANADELVLVFGSFFTVAEVRPALVGSLRAIGE